MIDNINLLIKTQTNIRDNVYFFIFYLIFYLENNQTCTYDNKPGGERLSAEQCEHPREERDQGVCLGLADQDWGDRFLPV